MRYSEIVRKARESCVSTEPSLVRPPDAHMIVGSEKLFDAMVAAGWIKPVVQQNRLTLYSVSAVKAACSRIVIGEMPPRVTSNANDESEDTI